MRSTFLQAWGTGGPGVPGPTFVNLAHATAMRVEKKCGERGYRVVAYFPPGCLPDEKARSVRMHHTTARRDATQWMHRLIDRVAEADTVRVQVSVD